MEKQEREARLKANREAVARLNEIAEPTPQKRKRCNDCRSNTKTTSEGGRPQNRGVPTLRSGSSLRLERDLGDSQPVATDAADTASV